MRALACLMGQTCVYEQSSELFKELLDVEFSAMQIQRLCVH